MTKSGAAGLYYKTLIEVTENMNLNEFQFNQVLASNPQAIRGGEFSISGIYTKKGYKTVIFPKSKSILKAAIDENWVLGDGTAYTKSEFKYLHKQILNLYFADYRKKWSRALAKISVPKYVVKRYVETKLGSHNPYGRRTDKQRVLNRDMGRLF